ncbi:MAG: helix-turn-helix domain-containing protein, partial [Pseudolabrys sp.]
RRRADAESVAYRNGFSAGQQKARDEAAQRAAEALVMMAGGLEKLDRALADIEARLETEAVEVAVAAKLAPELIACQPFAEISEDLLFRLNVVNLKIPPLRERPADIRELAQHFIKKYAAANGMPVRPLSAEARRAFNTNRWPGNLRELENTIHRALLLSTGPEIGTNAIRSPDGARLDQTRGTGAAAHAAQAAEQVTRNLVGRTVAEVERDLILETLRHCLGNRTHAANILGISIRTLRNKLNEYAADGAPIPLAGGGGEMRGAA